ncbi:glycosylated lysosomal membrane protein [Plakobranchus ocellatus]|uniref:Glycosylated lysosomal membrane protein n=1 Tax=Plakobranchus ocellatus TaxID=259542 RepID=A0AAV4AF81_9GAST|nr:glycosylated lysosomal membrane protein [Plakobranchus ocellatus]
MAIAAMNKSVPILKLTTLWIFVWIMVFTSTDALKRKLQTNYWPNCKDFQESCNIARSLGDNVVYTKASTDQNDNLHYVFSTIGIPTVMLARTTGADADLYFEWDQLMSNDSTNSVFLKNTKGVKVEYMYAVTFTQLIEYNDTNDHADLTNKELEQKNFIFRDFRNFFWKTLPLMSNGDNEIVFNSTTDSPAKQSNNGSISFSFKVHENDGRSSELPALVYSANVTQFDFVLANYTPSFSKSRFALEAVLVSLTDSQMSINEVDSIDDEYSPGVFQINNWLSNPKKQHISGFLQWKPVSYLSESRSRKSATKVKHYKLADISDRELSVEQVNSSIVLGLFGHVFERKDVTVKASNISFGLSGDGFYLENNYTVWSASIGYGQPPADALSTTVIIIISAGLGIPVILIIFGGIYTIFRRTRGRSGYQAINNGSINRSNPQVN